MFYNHGSYDNDTMSFIYMCTYIILLIMWDALFVIIIWRNKWNNEHFAEDSNLSPGTVHNLDRKSKAFDLKDISSKKGCSTAESFHFLHIFH